MRAVVDTNVLLSGILFGGMPGRILAAIRDARVRLAVTPESVDEYVRVGERLNARYPGVDVQPLLALIVQNADVVADEPLPSAVCSDPDDDKFIACTLGGGVEVVVSGDRALRAVSGYQGVEVVSPRRFVNRSRRESGGGRGL